MLHPNTTHNLLAEHMSPNLNGDRGREIKRGREKEKEREHPVLGRKEAH